MYHYSTTKTLVDGELLLCYFLQIMERIPEAELTFGNVLFYRHDPYGNGWQILLLKKDRGWPYGNGQTFWTVFGGHINQGESSLECAQREGQEELGLEAPIDTLEWFDDISAELNGEMKHAAQYISEFTWKESDITLGEGCGWAFWYLDEIDTLPLVAHERPVIQKLIQKLRAT